MPDQPDDPIHYDMKIPPEPKDAPLNKESDQSGDSEANKADAGRNKEDRISSGQDQTPKR
ncbi:MAG TPA: hypothetical protein VGJ21_03765 [Terracidiphilus sp.]|jgi:hypothetical protein